MKRIFFFLFFVLFAIGARGADVYVDADFVVAAGQTVSDNLFVTSDVKIENHGNITGNIVIQNPGTSVRFINSGTISGNVDNTVGAAVDQIVRSGAELNAIGNLSGHDILVETNTATHLNFNRLLQIAQNSNEINIRNTSFVIGTDFVPRNVNITVTGPTIFYVTNLSDEITNFFASHVHGMEYVHIELADSLFGIDSGASGGIVRFVRQTNYGATLGNKLGEYLDNLRDKNPNDKLLAALDSVDNMSDFNDILSHSVRVHPIMMMDFVKTFNTFDLSMPVYDGGAGVHVLPFYLGSGDFSVFGANANFVAHPSDKFYTNFGLFGGNMEYNGDYDEFSGFIYGADFGAKYETTGFFVRTQGILSVVNFNDVMAFDGNTGVNNPTGWGANLDFDFGPVFSLAESTINIKPFIGTDLAYLSIMQSKSTDVNAMFGAEAEITKTVDGNKYGYGAKTFIKTDSAIYGGLFAKMTSVADGVGGALNGAILKDINGLSYRISLDINFVF